MKTLILSLFDRPLIGRLLAWLGRPLAGRPKLLGLTNPLYRRYLVVAREGALYAAPRDSYLVNDSPADAIVRFRGEIYEPEIALLIERLVKPGNVAIDVGANVGLHTVAMAAKVGDGHVLAFEPVPDMLERNSINCALNGVDNVTLIPAALGEETGSATIMANISGGGMEGTSSMMDSVHVKRHPENYQELTIPVRRLDDVIKERDLKRRIGFIKIDTEGFEPAVLRGAMETIKRDKPAMIVEAHSTRLKAFGLGFSWYTETFPDYHVLIVHSTPPGNPYLSLEPLGDEPPEIAVNLLLLPKTESLDISID